MNPANLHLAGIGLMLLSCFVSAGNSALSKTMLLVYPVTQVLLFRSVSALTLATPFVSVTAIQAAPRRRLQFFRFVINGLEAGIFFVSITYLPLIDVMTYYLAGPIYVTALSVVFLGEKVGWRRWTAVSVGFIGVLIALRPSEAALSWPALLALSGSILYAFVLMTTRMLRGTSDTVLLVSQFSALFLVTAVAAPFYWISPSLRDAALMALIGAFTLVSAFCTNRSLKLAPASVVVPYQYTLLLWGGVFGYVVFGERPAPTTLIGAAIIIAAGVYIFLREAKLKAEAPVPPPPV